MVFMLKLHNPRTPIVQGLLAIDWIGSLLIVGGTLMLLLGLEFGGTSHPWDSATVICLIIFGVVTVGVFVVYEARVATYAVIPPSLFRQQTSVVAYTLSFLHAFTFMGGIYWMPLYFQSCLAATSLLSGVYLLPFVLSFSLLSIVTGLFTKKTGNYRIPIISGFFIMTLGFGLFIDLGTDRNWAKIIIFQIIAGCGLGPNFQTPLLAVQTNVEPREIGSATASFTFLRQLGTSVSVVVGGIIFNNKMQNQHDSLVDHIGTELAELFGSKDAAANVQEVVSLPLGDRQVVQHAYWNAMQNMYIFYTCVGFAAFLISLFIVQTALSKSHTEHKTGLASLKRRDALPSSDEEKKSRV